MVLALHACDTATDEALARAVEWGAQLVLAAPCCHHDIAAQLRRAPTPAPYALLTRHGILRERFADTLTDALRASLMRLQGYRVDVMQFVESQHTPRNTMLRAVRTGGPVTGGARPQGVRRAGRRLGAPPAARRAAGERGCLRRLLAGIAARALRARARLGGAAGDGGPRDEVAFSLPRPGDRGVQRPRGRRTGCFVTTNDSGDSGRVFAVDPPPARPSA